ncbi:MAG: GrpB family protein, partial [Bacteroidota bacterium]
HPVLDDLQHHLYVCHQDSPELRRHLLFRDYLRKHIWARVEYGELKLRIAITAGQDRKRYARLKEAEARKFIEDVLAMAAEPA